MEGDWDTLGLACRRVAAAPMAGAHRHHEVELNFLDAGEATYLAGGGLVRVEAGRLTAFWGAIPHQIVAVEGGGALYWLTVPLAAFLGFGLPPRLADSVLHGRFASSSGADADLDRRLFERWADDLLLWPERAGLVLLEIEARLRRLDFELERGEPPAGARPWSVASLARAERMARFVAEHATEPVRVADVARAAGLSESHAMALFRATFGTSLGAHLTRHRVARAERLLATTDMSVLDVAAEAGFGSASRFHDAFRRACGCSPLRYRRRVRGTG